jgi:hypothetical protein
MNEDPAKQAWQASVEIAGAPPLEEVRKGADKFYRRIRRRNAVEYVACVVVVVAFTAYVFVLPHVLQKLGSAMIVLATFYVAWQLHRRASAEPPEKAGTMPLLAFARAQMLRQRDALRSIFWWYILPFIPGLVVMSLGNGLDPELAANGPPIWVRWLVFAGMGAVLAGVWWLNQYGARKLERRIDEIDALTGEHG